jgi:hypothetical protein
MIGTLLCYSGHFLVKKLTKNNVIALQYVMYIDMYLESKIVYIFDIFWHTYKKILQKLHGTML